MLERTHKAEKRFSVLKLLAEVARMRWHSQPSSRCHPSLDSICKGAARCTGFWVRVSLFECSPSNTVAEMSPWFVRKSWLQLLLHISQCPGPAFSLRNRDAVHAEIEKNPLGEKFS